jgi:hypothetical protein
MAETLVQPAAYSPLSAYYQYLKKGKDKGKGCGCGEKRRTDGQDCVDCGKRECSCEQDKNGCGCPPAGLVSVFDDSNTFLGFLTPADAELFTQNTLKCNDGYSKMFNNSTGQFIGCVSEGNYATMYALINPA